MLLSIENIYKIYNDVEILSDISLTIENNERIGLVGVNGCGKTTLLSIIVGKIGFDKTPGGDGSVSVANGVRIGYLEQHTGLEGDASIADEMRLPFKHLDEEYERMQQLEKSLNELEGKALEEAEAEYTALSSHYENNDGYIIDVKINTVLNGMGFAGVDKTRAMNSLSGGERTRLALAKLLLEEPQLLVLDEPTNHLDLDTMMWLEDYLSEYKGSVLVVSHNRYFLDKLCTRICEIERGKLKSYKGNYSFYIAQKKADNVRQEKLYEAQQKKISELQFFIDKNRASATSAKAAKSKQHMLDRILDDAVEKPRTYQKPAKIKLEYDIVPPKDVFEAVGVDISVGEGESAKTLIDSFSLKVRRGEKVGIIGANGIGKSSILKTIQSINPHTRGKINWAMNVKTAYFDQKNEQLDPRNSVMEEVHKRYPRMTDYEVRSILGSVLLTNENVFKPVGVISGGEKTKLSFALMMLRRANVLILDEPTNHLDILTKEVLEDALAEYDGTVIFVSHDRYLLNRIATRIVEVTKDGVNSYEGNFDKYLEQKEKEKENASEFEREAPVKAEEPKKQYRTKQQRADDVKRKQETKELEARIEELEGLIVELEAKISEPEIAGDYQKLSEACNELENAKNELNDCMDRWVMM